MGGHLYWFTGPSTVFPLAGMAGAGCLGLFSGERGAPSLDEDWGAELKVYGTKLWEEGEKEEEEEESDGEGTMMLLLLLLLMLPELLLMG